VAQSQPNILIKLAVDAVFSEPVSEGNSLINSEFTGKTTGKWSTEIVKKSQKAIKHGAFSTSVV
jgi:hypothetical protein